MESNTSSTFRSAPQQTKPQPLPTAKQSPLTPVDTGIDVPYTDYSMEHGHPYTVDYFKLGDSWDVFNKEVGIIEGYVNDRIRQGEIANSPKAVEKEMKAMEKLHNVKDDERSVVRIGVLSSYIKFLNETKDIKKHSNY